MSLSVPKWIRLVTGCSGFSGLSRWTAASTSTTATIARAVTATARAVRNRQTGSWRTRGRTASAREAIEGSEANEESGDCRSPATWRRVDSSSWSERATSAIPNRSKAALLARRWPAEKP